MRAKLCERGREVLLNAGGSNGKKYDSGVDFAFCVFAIIRLGFKQKKLQKLRKAVGFLNILLYSLLFAWVLWKLLDANPYFVAIRIGFERILEMLSLQVWVSSNLFAGPYKLVEEVVSTVELHRSYQQKI